MSEQDEHEYTCKREHIVIAHELLKEADHLMICIIQLEQSYSKHKNEVV